MNVSNPQLYVIESIRNLDGTPHEREVRRKGQRVELLNCNVGQALLLVYCDDYNKLMWSTPVEMIGGTGAYPGGLVVYT